MPDPDAYKAGGSSGVFNRAAQLAALRASNRRRMAESLRQSRNVLAGRPRMSWPGQANHVYTAGRYAGLTQAQYRRMRPAPPKPRPKPHSATRKPEDMLGLGMFGDGAPGSASRPSHFGNFMRDLDPETRHDTTDTHVVDDEGRLGIPLPGHSALPVATGDYMNRDPDEIKRFQRMTRPERDEVRSNVEKGNSPAKVFDKTVSHMLDLINKDPMKDGLRTAAGRDLADAFRDMSKTKYFTNEDLLDNPMLGMLNELSVWADFRIRVQDFNDSKRKTGDVELEDEETGDGSYGGQADVGSFSQATGPGNLSKWIVARDENGLLQVVSADQWIQAKYARMRHDPKYAAQMITALAVTAAYGSDSTANSQRTRLVMGKDGNPVKGFPSKKDLSALKWLANEVAILQNQGDEVAIDDSIAELTKSAFDVTAGAQAAGDLGGGGYGGYGGGGGYGYGGGGGYGYGGGGGGGEGAVRFTDGTQLTSMVSSIARQRMGRELTPAESAAFVKYYHGLESSNTAAYYAGQSNTMLDPEGQAVAWVTSHFADQLAQEQFGTLAADFFAMMGGENPFGGISS